MSTALRIEFSFVGDKPSLAEQLTPLIPHLVELGRVYLDVLRPKSPDIVASAPSYSFASSFTPRPASGFASSSASEGSDPLSWLWQSVSNPDELARTLKMLKMLDPALYSRIRHAMMEPDVEEDADDLEVEDAGGNEPDQDGDGEE